MSTEILDAGRIQPYWQRQHYENLPWITLESTNPTGYVPVGADINSRLRVYRGLPPELDHPELDRAFGGYKDPSWAVNCIDPGEILPWHRDLYGRYLARTPGVELKQIVRALVFLEDRRQGQYFEIEGRPLTDWRSGDWLLWSSDQQHISANLSDQPRYALQFTAHK